VLLPIKLKNILRVGNKFITFVLVKYNELFRLLKKDGWFEVRQKGSHVIMKHAKKTEQLTVPYHSGKEVKKGLLRALLKQADIKTDKR
jgi:predicted RNA binding protein YcfA (HicA-like mRNA interferase family)